MIRRQEELTVARKRKAKRSAGKGARRGAAKKSRKPACLQADGPKEVAQGRQKDGRAHAKRAASAKPTRSGGRAKAGRKPSREATPAGGMYGEGNWKADEEYRNDLEEWSETHDAEQLAREAEEDLPPDLRDDEDDDLAESARHGAEEEPEW
jgi:hypothetical protein